LIATLPGSRLDAAPPVPSSVPPGHPYASDFTGPMGPGPYKKPSAWDENGY